jgi:hypothetical protein
MLPEERKEDQSDFFFGAGGARDLRGLKRIRLENHQLQKYRLVTLGAFQVEEGRGGRVSSARRAGGRSSFGRFKVGRLAEEAECPQEMFTTSAMGIFPVLFCFFSFTSSISFSSGGREDGRWVGERGREEERGEG